METLKIMLDAKAIMPTRAHDTDAGLDLYTPERIVIWPHDSYVVDLGVHMAIAPGYCGITKSRSGLNFNQNVITVDGVIDASYRGSIKVKLYNLSDVRREIEAGSRISQLVIIPVATPEIIQVEELDETERGNNGFGSSGLK